MRDLSFLGIGKSLQKYRIEIGVSRGGALARTFEMLRRRGKRLVKLAENNELSKIFTNYGSTMRRKLRAAVCVHGATIFCDAACEVDSALSSADS